MGNLPAQIETSPRPDRRSPEAWRATSPARCRTPHACVPNGFPLLVGAAGQPPPWRSPGFDATAGFGRLVRFLPEERRAAVFGNGDDLRREIRQSLRTMRRAQHGIEEALAAEPFDPDRLAASLEDFRAQFASNQQRSHAGLVSIMERLAPDERRKFVESIPHMRDPRRHRDRRSDERDRDGARDG